MSVQADPRYWKLPPPGPGGAARIDTTCRVKQVRELSAATWLARLDCADGAGRHPFEVSVARTPKSLPPSLLAGQGVRLSYARSSNASAPGQWLAVHDASGKRLLVAWIRAQSLLPPGDDGSFFSPFRLAQVTGIEPATSYPCCKQPCSEVCPRCPAADVGHTYRQEAVAVEFVVGCAQRLMPRQPASIASGHTAFLGVGFRVFDTTCTSVENHSELDLAIVGPAAGP